PSAIVKSLALKKALKVARKFPDTPVVGADTIVVCRGKILGKPKNKKDALKLLHLQNGAWQSVYTGIAVVWNSRGKKLVACEVSRCKARKFSDEKLLRLAGKHLDKAGAYAAQDKNDPFIEKIIGPFDNVVGLPVKLLKKLLRKL
ncbi:MAG: Maf family protein, partial [Elusimicrobia bacterium]|nr:Maf family protein [Elusimicrobiota bacterium]